VSQGTVKLRYHLKPVRSKGQLCLREEARGQEKGEQVSTS
jgi:hypothetical protein